MTFTPFLSRQGPLIGGGNEQYDGQSKKQIDYNILPTVASLSEENRHFAQSSAGNSSNYSADHGEYSSDQALPGKILPNYFVPAPYTVVIGKGQTPNKFVGNRRMRILATAVLQKYVSTQNRKEKTEVITGLIETVRAVCPIGSFVKLQEGRWWEVSDQVVREKVGYIIRDLLHHRYRSSSKSKGALRQKRRKQEHAEAEGKPFLAFSSKDESSHKLASDEQVTSLLKEKPAGTAYSSSNATIREGHPGDFLRLDFDLDDERKSIALDHNTYFKSPTHYS